MISGTSLHSCLSYIKLKHIIIHSPAATIIGSVSNSVRADWTAKQQHLLLLITGENGGIQREKKTAPRSYKLTISEIE